MWAPVHRKWVSVPKRVEVGRLDENKGEPFMFVNNSVDSRRTLRLAVLLGAMALGSAPAQATTDLFLKWPGIPGTSTNQSHLGEIELLSYTQTASNIPVS